MPTYIHKKNYLFLTTKVENYPVRIITSDSYCMRKSHLLCHTLRPWQIFDESRRQYYEDMFKKYYVETINLEDFIPFTITINGLRNITKNGIDDMKKNCINRKTNRRKKLLFLQTESNNLQIVQTLSFVTNLSPVMSMNLIRPEYTMDIANWSLQPKNEYQLTIDNIDDLLARTDRIVEEYNAFEKIESFILKKADAAINQNNVEMKSITLQTEDEDELNTVEDENVEEETQMPLSPAHDISNQLQMFECQVQLTSRTNTPDNISQVENINQIDVPPTPKQQEKLNEFSIKIMEDLSQELEHYLKQINESRIIENKILTELEMCLQERRRPMKRGKYTCKMTHSNMLLMNSTKQKAQNNATNKKPCVTYESNVDKCKSKIPKYLKPHTPKPSETALQCESKHVYYNQLQEIFSGSKDSNAFVKEITNIEDPMNCSSLIVELEETFIKHLEDHHKFLLNLHKIQKNQHENLIQNKQKQLEILLNDLITVEENELREKLTEPNDTEVLSELQSEIDCDEMLLNPLNSENAKENCESLLECTASRDSFEDVDSLVEEKSACKASEHNLYNILSEQNTTTCSEHNSNELSELELENVEEVNESNSIDCNQTESISKRFSQDLDHLFRVQSQLRKQTNVELKTSSDCTQVKQNDDSTNPIQKSRTIDSKIFAKILKKQKSLLTISSNRNSYVQIFETVFHPFYSKRSSFVHSDFSGESKCSKTYCIENGVMVPKRSMSLYTFKRNLSFSPRCNGFE